MSHIAFAEGYHRREYARAGQEIPQQKPEDATDADDDAGGAADDGSGAEAGAGSNANASAGQGDGTAG